MTKKKSIIKYAIVKREVEKTKATSELEDTTLIAAKKGKSVYCLEQKWVEHVCYYFLVNMYTYKIQYMAKAKTLKEYLDQLIDIGFDLTYYLDWDDLLADFDIKIPNKYGDSL